MARTDYGAILSTVIKDTSDAVREVNGTSSLIAPNQWGTAIRTMHSDSDYENALEQMIEETATGDIASFSDGANNIPCPSVLCTINPVQDLHGQDCPYPSGGGINKWDEEWEIGGYDSSGNKQANPNIIRSKNKIVIGANTQFYFKCGNSNPTARFVFWDSNDNLISATARYDCNAVNTSPNNAYYMAFNIGADYGNTYKNDISINIPSSNTAYHPYSNICPITGHTELNLVHTGKNLLNGEHEKTTQTDNGLIIPTGGTAFKLYMFSGKLPVGSVALYDPITGSNSTHQLVLAKNGSFFKYYTGGAYTFNVTSSDDTYTVILYVYRGNTDTLIKPQMEIGSTSTAYEPYTGTTTTTDLGTTVYGATLDVVSGELVVDRGLFLLSDITLSYAPNSGKPYVYALIPDYYGNGAYNVAVSDCICSMLPAITRVSIMNNGTGFQFESNHGFYIADNDIDKSLSAQNFIDAVQTKYGNAQFRCLLTTPTTTHLTPTEVKSLLGSNNIYHDCNGDTDVTYRANGALYVEQHS